MEIESHSDFDNGQPPNVSGTSKKRSREEETESERLKREKAAKRQQRKRERDRSGVDSAQPDGFQQTMANPSQPTRTNKRNPPAPRSDNSQDLTPEEEIKREKVRKAARERQKKHRDMLRMKKERQLGEDMGNMPPELQYRVNAEGVYEQIQPHELQQLQQEQQLQPRQEPPFPQGQLLGGQTFASTLLLSFSCAPLLKSHLLRSLHMTSEELTSLEPILADAWDRWDHGRRVHYAEQVAAAIAAGGSAAAGGPLAGPSSYTLDPNVGNNMAQMETYTNGPPPGARLVSESIDPQLANIDGVPGEGESGA